MNYQNIICWGDSQTFGARSYGCYPLYLAKILNSASPYVWRAINRSSNGFTARDLWFMINQEIDSLHDIYQACLLIGTNDVGEHTPPALFAEYYRQMIQTLRIKRYKAIYCGEIPPIYADGHVFFSHQTPGARNEYNALIQTTLREFPNTHWVTFPTLTREDYEDSVHFNESGNEKVAQAFAQAILAR